MKAKMLLLTQSQGMCSGTPIDPSAAKTLPQPPPCLHQALPTQFPRQQGAWWWMLKGGNRDPTTFSCLSLISHCLRKNHEHTHRKASQAHKMSAHSFSLSHLWWLISCVAQICLSENTWLFEPFCWYSNEQALFVTLLFAFYLVTMTFPWWGLYEATFGTWCLIICNMYYDRRIFCQQEDEMIMKVILMLVIKYLKGKFIFISILQLTAGI